MVAFIQWNSRIPWKNIWKVDEISIETVKPLVILMEYLSFALVLELCSSVFFVCFHSSIFFLCTCSLFYLGGKKKRGRFRLCFVFKLLQGKRKINFQCFSSLYFIIINIIINISNTKCLNEKNKNKHCVTFWSTLWKEVREPLLFLSQICDSKYWSSP